jgi:hypothetical protein
MLIKCRFLLSRESVRDYLRQFSDSPPLPEYIIKTGPYTINTKGAFHRIIILYKFDKPHFAVARECISQQLSPLRGLPGFTLSAHTYGPRPYHLTLEKSEEINECPDLDSIARLVPYS